MKISKLLLIIILIPISIGIVVSCYFQFANYQSAAELSQSTIERKHNNFLNHLEEMSIHAKKISEILSQNKEVIAAISANQTHFLSNEAINYSKIDEGEIYFTNTSHQIIAQSKLGNLPEKPFIFNETCNEKQLLNINQELKITYCQKIFDTNNNLIGFVLSMGPLNHDFFKEMSEEYYIESEFTYENIKHSSFKNKAAMKNYEPHDLIYKIGQYSIHFILWTDNTIAQKNIKNTFIILISITFLIGITLIILLPYFLNKYISKPLQLVEKKIELFDNNEIINDSEQVPQNEIKDIYQALHQLHLASREKEHQLKEKTDILEKDNLLLRVISHDVSNTLVVIHASLLRLKRTEQITLQKKNELVDKILATVKSAGSVLQHVKEVKALETGKVKLELEPTSIAEVFNLAQVIFDDRLTEKKIVLTLDDRTNGALFLCHKTSFTNSVFNNFISNGIKFSPIGSEILVITEIINEKYCISIKDQGIGIPEEIASNLFDIGKVTSRKGTNGEAGTGFGMNIAKQYMEHYNGELHFTTQTIGKTGTTFELLLQKVS